MVVKVIENAFRTRVQLPSPPLKSFGFSGLSGGVTVIRRDEMLQERDLPASLLPLSRRNNKR